MILIFLIPAILTALVWWPTLGIGALADDFNILQRVIDGGAFGLWASPGQGWFRPLVSLSFWLDMHLWHNALLGMHVTNLILHALNAGLVGVSVLLWVKLFPRLDWDVRKQRCLAIIAAAAFALLPCHAESVAWISDRTDLLSTFFAVICLDLYLWARRRNITPWLAWGAFALALSSKEAVVTLPAVVVLVEWMRSGRPRVNKAWLLVLPWFFTVLCYVCVRTLFVGALVGGYGASVHFGATPLHMLVQPFLSFGKMLVPNPLIGLHLFSVTNLVLWRHENQGIYFVLGLLLALASFVRKPLESWGLLMVCAAWLLPSASLGFQLENSINERFLYFPSVIFILWITLKMGAWPRKTLALLLTIACVGWAASSVESALRWREGGLVVQQIQHSLQEKPIHENTVFVGVPDNIAGALVFRSGLEMSVLQNDGIKRVQIPALLTCWTMQDSLIQTQSGDTLKFMSSQPLARWLPTENGAENNYARISVDGRELQLVVSRLPGSLRLLSCSGQ